MLITRVEIKNIKNHAEASFEFNPGVTAICGPNGAGKTTIIEAIAWALFDYLDYNREDFVRRGTKRGHVTISFRSDLDDREYQVSRDTAGGYFVYDPDTKVKLIEQKKEVVSWLKQQIGVDPGTDLATLFKTTIGVPQGTFTADFLQPPAPRKKIFDQILKVEEYRQAADNLRATQKYLDSRINELDRKLAEAEGEMKIYEEVKQHFEASVSQLSELEKEQVITVQSRTKFERQVLELSALSDQLTQQRGMVERTQIKRDLIHGNLGTAREAAEQARLAAAIVSDSRAGFEQYQNATKRLMESEQQRATRDALRQQANQTEREADSAKIQIGNAHERLCEVKEARSELTRLSDSAAEQELLEKKLVSLRESRGQIQGLQHAQEALNRELDRLRIRYADINQQLKEMDQYRAEAEKAETLESEYRALTEKISQQELVRQRGQMKRDQLWQAQNEYSRQQTEQTKLSREISRLQPFAEQVAKLHEAETKQQKESDRLANLKAEVARDTDMIAALESGGICPLLSEKCLNLKPGESLDNRFKTGLAARRQEIAKLEKASALNAQELKKLRVAEAEITRLPKLREELKTIESSLKKQQLVVIQLQSETEAFSPSNENETHRLQQQRNIIEGQLKQARESQKKFNQLEGFLHQREAIKAEGENKRQDREALEKKLALFGDVASQLIETENRLQILGDPRTRVVTLRQIIQRENEWKQQEETASRNLKNVMAKLDQINRELEKFAALEIMIAESNAARASSETAYQAYIANEKIASTLEARETEVKSLSDESVKIESALNAATAQLVQLEEKYKPQEHQHAIFQYNQHRERATQIATQLEHVRATHEKLQNQITYLNEVQEKRRADLAIREKQMQIREATEFIRDILQKAAPYLTEAYLRSVSIEANQLFREITGRYDVTLKWENDYEIFLEEQGFSRPYANLSGGEQMAAALAIRLALLREFSDNLSLAFFDEPTTNMDEDRRRNLAQQIGRITGFKQLFVISHDDSFENFTDQVVMLGERG